MKKLITLIAVLMMPCLVLAKGPCQRLSDEEYRNQLTSHPHVEPYNEFGGTGTLTIIYDKNGTGKMHAIFKGYFGAGTIDAEFTWSVNNAILHTHTTSITHSDTHNKDLNEVLDEITQMTMAEPDYDEPLDICK